MKVRITQTLLRTIELDVESSNELDAVAAALLLASDIQPADWSYTWVPIAEEGCAVTE